MVSLVSGSSVNWLMPNKKFISFNETLDEWVMKDSQHEKFRGYLEASGSTMGIGKHTWTIHNDSKVAWRKLSKIICKKHMEFSICRGGGLTGSFSICFLQLTKMHLKPF